jgi:AcrR family transcriptional regulator
MCPGARSAGSYRDDVVSDPRSLSDPPSPSQAVPELDAARARAVDRYQRLVVAAFELTLETGNTDFRLQDVATRARVSLRAFYQHFSNRDELLLAVFEHAVNGTVPVLADAVAAHDDPVEQLHAYVHTMYRLVFGDERLDSRPLTGYHLHLAQTNPSALAKVLEPRNELLIAVLERGVERGAFRSDIELKQMAMLLSHTLVAAMHANVLGTYMAGSRLDSDTLWAFCLGSVTDPRP